MFYLTDASYWITYGFSKVSSSLAWRIPLILQVIWDIIIIVFCIFLPDSPRWLFNQGRHEEGTRALQALRNLPANFEELLAEKDDIITAIQLEQANASSWKACFVDGGIRGNKRVFLACLTLAFQQLSGTNSMFPLILISPAPLLLTKSHPLLL